MKVPDRYCLVRGVIEERISILTGDNDPKSPISSTSMWFPDPDKPDSPLNKELPPLRTVPIAVPYWSDGTVAFK